ncbi:MAG: NAD(P)/FAD-dependent oxidoreductase [Microcystaceae cyanobacterium]
MIKTYDFIVVGGGITGAAIAYELQKQGVQVLLVEKEAQPLNASYYSYGGIPYWSGQTTIQKQLCQEGHFLLANLAAELDGITEYRELDLLLTLSPQDDYQLISDSLKNVLIPPQFIDPAQAKVLEPLLNEKAIAGAFTVSHGHVNVEKMIYSYRQAFLRLGGKFIVETVNNLLIEKETITGIQTNKNCYSAHQTIICAGALSRQLLSNFDLELPLYFTHAFVIKTPPLDLTLRTLIMPAAFQRLALKQDVKKLDWHQAIAEVKREVIEPGAIQFQDGSFYLGQISQLMTDPHHQSDRALAEQKLRSSILELLPGLGDFPGECHHCLVAFSDRTYPLIGPIPELLGLQLFTGFSSTILYAPILARHFAQWLTIQKDDLIAQLL